MRVGNLTIVGLLGLGLGGCGDANSSPHAGGSAGSPAGGGSVGLAGSVGAGGSAALVDPPAAEPDLTGLVPTSARWLLVTVGNSVVVSSSLDFVDLESGMRYPVNPANLPVAYGYWSPDQKSFLFSGANADSDKNLTLLRLTKNGFVPAKLIDGFEGTRGCFSTVSWDETSRFLSVARGGSMSDGVELIDSVLGKRLGHVDFPPSFSHTFAPKGPYFGWSHGNAMAHEAGISRVVKDGIAPLSPLPADAYMAQFSSDGKRAFFGRMEANVLHTYYLDLPDMTPKELVITTAGEKLSSTPSPGPTADSVLAYVEKTETDRQYLQAFTDGRARVALSDPTKKVRFQFESSDRNIHAVDYETSLDIVRVEPFARFPLPGSSIRDEAGYWSTGVVGQHVYHQVQGQLYVASVNGSGALSDVAVGTPGEPVSVCELYSSHTPTTKLAYRTVKDDLTSVVVVDLAASPPAVSARVSASVPGNYLSCPYFSRDESSMVVSETDKKTSKIYGVKWTGGVATEPELVLESEGDLLIRAFSY